MYLDATALGARLAEQLRSKGLSQSSVADRLETTQGEISKILHGQFKTRNPLVAKLCKYVNINPVDFRRTPKTIRSRPDAVLALSLACKGQQSREKAVVRILRAIQDLD
jgi:transcriptional regulator with XRE-family HTH domain